MLLQHFHDGNSSIGFTWARMKEVGGLF